jgi:hypothetical protein
MADDWVEPPRKNYRPRIECPIDDIEIPIGHATKLGPPPETRPGVRATCGDCGHQVECAGRGVPSVKRALMMLRETCPEKQDNFYVSEK